MKRLLAAVLVLMSLWSAPASGQTISVELGAGLPQRSYDGRVLLVFSKVAEPEPRFLAQRGADSAQIFGVDVEGWTAGGTTSFRSGVIGYPLVDMAEIPAGRYHVQALLHKYDTYRLGDGKVVKLPAPRGAGQNWRKEPGNVFSRPRLVSFDPRAPGEIRLTLDTVIPPVPEPVDTEFIRYFKFRSPSLSRFWGRDIFLNGHVLVPKDFDRRPRARYPLMVNHGHFPETFSGFRTAPPDPNLVCSPSARFNHPCYNRVEQQEAYDFYRRWTSADFPRFLIVEIDHSNPYFDDSYAVNSANLGPDGPSFRWTPLLSP